MADFILTHPGSAHKDDFLACCVLLSKHAVEIQRRDPTDEDLDNSETYVVDIGHRHEPEMGNFDHHQFPRDATPTCALSLVLKYLKLYEDARSFCDWLETAEWLDCRGAKGTAEWLGVERAIVNKLSSPIDATLLRRFASKPLHSPGEPLWEIMRMIGQDLVGYLSSLRKRLDLIDRQCERWTLQMNGQSFEAIFLPRTDPLPEDPSMGLPRYIDEKGLGGSVIAMVYPDRRSDGYGLTRYNDHPSMDFTKIGHEADVHFAHASGFVAKTSATDPERLKELLAASFAGNET